MVTPTPTSAVSADSLLTPAEMVDRTGVTLDTLRYYESEGLLSDVARAANGHRRYSEGDVRWINVLRCLRDTGMSMAQLRHYCDLGDQGAVTRPERKRILLAHRSLVEQQIEERRRALDLIDGKLGAYADVEIDVEERS
ncbi:MAG: MerR family transcriptional regulator [Actinomycetota bacterium]